MKNLFLVLVMFLMFAATAYAADPAAPAATSAPDQSTAAPSPDQKLDGKTPPVETPPPVEKKKGKALTAEEKAFSYKQKEEFKAFKAMQDSEKAEFVRRQLIEANNKKASELQPTQIINNQIIVTEPPWYKSYKFWLPVAVVAAAGATIGGVCGAGYCDPTPARVNVN